MCRSPFALPLCKTPTACCFCSAPGTAKRCPTRATLRTWCGALRSWKKETERRSGVPRSETNAEPTGRPGCGVRRCASSATTTYCPTARPLRADTRARPIWTWCKCAKASKCSSTNASSRTQSRRTKPPLQTRSGGSSECIKTLSLRIYFWPNAPLSRTYKSRTLSDMMQTETQPLISTLRPGRLTSEARLLLRVSYAGGRW